MTTEHLLQACPLQCTLRRQFWPVETTVARKLVGSLESCGEQQPSCGEPECPLECSARRRKWTYSLFCVWTGRIAINLPFEFEKGKRESRWGPCTCVRTVRTPQCPFVRFRKRRRRWRRQWSWGPTPSSPSRWWTSLAMGWVTPSASSAWETCIKVCRLYIARDTCTFVYLWDLFETCIVCVHCYCVSFVLVLYQFFFLSPENWFIQSFTLFLFVLFCCEWIIPSFWFYIKKKISFILLWLIQFYANLNCSSMCVCTVMVVLIFCSFVHTFFMC